MKSPFLKETDMPREQSHSRAAIFLLLILTFSYLFLFLNLGAYSLKEPDEGRYAEIPREMVERGDYVVPHLNYVRYFEKPPLLYWLDAASYKAFGISEWSFRFPNALAALLCVLTICFFVSRWFSGKAAFISSLILMTSFGFFAMARVVTIDMLFAFLLFGSLCCFYEYYREEKNLFLYLFHAGTALAILAKGPVAIVLLGATIVLFLLLEKEIPFLKKVMSLKGILLFAAIAAPWFVLMCIREKEFFHFFFVDQHILRFLTTRHRRSGPIYYFVPVLLGGLFPWSIFLPRAVARVVRQKEMRLFLIWSAVVFVFFSVSGSKLPPYILPIFPSLAVILGCLFDGEWRKAVHGRGEIIAYVAFFLCLVVGGLGFLYGPDSFFRSMPDIVSLRRGLTGLVAAVTSIAFAISLLLAFRRLRTFITLFCALCGFSAAVALGLMLHTNVIDRFNTTKDLAKAIDMLDKDRMVVGYHSFDETLPFYLQRRVYLADGTGELEMGAKYSDAQGFFLNSDEFSQLLRSGKPVFVVTKAKRLKEPEILGLKVIERQDTRCLLSADSGQSLQKTPGGR
jgi:4-amino-4-deoxy-L-arabinose transferase-like glycosyltransferase